LTAFFGWGSLDRVAARARRPAGENRGRRRPIRKPVPNRRAFLAATGEETIDYGYLPRGHTDGDIYVWFRNANVLAAGDVVAVGAYPVLDFTTGGWLGELIDATETLHGLVDDATKIVPGSGPVVGKAHVASQLAMLTTVYERLRTLARKSLSADEMCSLAPAAVAAQTR
jgi:glyoxylase-like metal-dependent hydrolase (beta-lactamase superfamily II)